MRSGTNARLFRTSFPTNKPKAEEEMEKHEARLATALGLDRAQRVLDLNQPPYQTDKVPRDSRAVPTQWNGTEWVKEGTLPSKSVIMAWPSSASNVSKSHKKQWKAKYCPLRRSSK